MKEKVENICRYYSVWEMSFEHLKVSFIMVYVYVYMYAGRQNVSMYSINAVPYNDKMKIQRRTHWPRRENRRERTRYILTTKKRRKNRRQRKETKRISSRKWKMCIERNGHSLDRRRYQANRNSKLYTKYRKMQRKWEKTKFLFFSSMLRNNTSEEKSEREQRFFFCFFRSPSYTHRLSERTGKEGKQKSKKFVVTFVWPNTLTLWWWWWWCAHHNSDNVYTANTFFSVFLNGFFLLRSLLPDKQFVISLTLVRPSFEKRFGQQYHLMW